MRMYKDKFVWEEKKNKIAKFGQKNELTHCRIWANGPKNVISSSDDRINLHLHTYFNNVYTISKI